MTSHTIAERPAALARPRLLTLVVLAAAVVAAGWLFGAAHASAAVTCNKTWDGGGGDGKWSTAANWDLNTLPSSASVVCINGATVHFDVNVLAANQTIDTLNGTGTLSIDANTLTILNGTNGGTEGQIANLTFAGGSLSGLNGATPTGTLKVGTALTVSSATTLNGVVLDVAGATTWSAGSISYANSAQLNNSGVFTDQTSSGISMPFGAGLFDNKAAGTYTKTGATLTTISVPFLNDGTVNVNSGELDIASSGPNLGATPDGGVYHVASGKTLGFTNGTRKLAPTGGNSNPSVSAVGATVAFGGSGTEVDGTFTAGSTKVLSLGSATLKGAITTTTLDVHSGNMRIDHNLSGATISLEDGTLGGSGTVSVTAGDTFSWDGFSTIGTNEGGIINIPATGSLQITGNQQHNMNGSTINNHGTAEWKEGDMEMSNSAVINNSGEFMIETDHEMLCCLGSPAFNNTGTVFKTSTSGTTLWQTPFDNTGGTLEIQSGTINFQGSLQDYDNATHTLSGGSFVIDSPATMEMFSADIQTIAANTSLTLDGPTSTILDASNTSNDGLRNLATVAATGSLTIKNSRNLTVPNGLSDAGTVAVGSGDVLTLTAGTFQVTSGGLLSGFGIVAGPVTNAGTVSPGMQPGDIGDITLDGTYTQAAGGKLRIEAQSTSSGEYDVVTMPGAHSAALAGTINVLNVSGFTPSNGDVITPVEYGTHSGQFATVTWTVPAGLIATAVYHPTSADLVVGPAATLGTPTMTKPAGAFQNRSPKFAVAWTAVSGTGIKYDVQMRSAPASTGTFGSFSQIKTGLNALTFQFQGTQGTAYCFEVRATKGATHSAFSSQKCTAVPFDDRALTRPAGTHWQLKKLFGYYLNTFLLTKTHNDSLTKAGVHAKTVAVVAEVCPTCGSISVTFGGTTKAFDLHAATTKREVLFVVDTGAMHTGTVTIKVTSTNKNVQIDGLGASPL